MQADEKKTLEPPVVQSLEDFKANCTLLENELAARESGCMACPRFWHRTLVDGTRVLSA